tara:strand:+ start:1352 stop:2761 length:1410 start_codon:yes stop_codon:yes gene_type:complete
MVSFNFLRLDLTSILIFGRSLGYLLKVLIPLILVRLFTQYDYGLYQKIIAIIILITTYFSFGIEQSILYFYNKKNKNFLINNYLLTFIVALIVSSVSFFSFLLLENYLDVFFNKIIFFKICLIVFFTIVNLPLDQFFIVKNNKKALLIFSLLNGLMRVFILILFIVLFENRIETLINFLITFESLKFILFTFYFYNNEKSNISIKLVFNEFLDILKYIIPLHLSNFFGMIGRSLDKNILLFMVSPSQFALYSIAMFRIPYIDIVKGSIGHVLIDKLSSVKTSMNKKNNLWNLASIKLASIVYPSIIIFFINADIIINILFTEKYIESVNLFRILILSFLLYPLITSYVFAAFNLKKTLLKAEFYSMVLSFLINPLLIYYYGILGACIGFTLVTLLNQCIQFYFIKIKTSFTFKKRTLTNIFNIISLYLISGLSIYFIFNYFDLKSLYSLVFQSLIFLIIFYKKSFKFFY